MPREIVTAKSRIVALLGVLMSLALAVVVPGPAGVYWARTDVTFLPPRSATGNPYGSDSMAVVQFASVVEREFNRGTVRVRPASNQAPLFGFGVQSGYSVAMPNSGSQWRPSYFSPKLTVEVADPIEAGARQQMSDIMAELKEIVRRRQVDADVPPSLRVKIAIVPEEPSVMYVTGNARRQQVALLLLGLLLTFGAVNLVESHDRRHRRVVSAG